MSTPESFVNSSWDLRKKTLMFAVNIDRTDGTPPTTHRRRREKNISGAQPLLFLAPTAGVPLSVRRRGLKQ
jgi:hypothetical protein